VQVQSLNKGLFWSIAIKPLALLPNFHFSRPILSQTKKKKKQNGKKRRKEENERINRFIFFWKSSMTKKNDPKLRWWTGFEAVWTTIAMIHS
jgi:hypothetical protein